MSTIRYIISDASKKIDVEPHVLRYWEEELNLEIPRNEMGHRYYREQDITTLKAVKILKEEGFQLKAIKMLLPDIDKIENLDPQSILKLREEMNEKATELENEEKVLDINVGTSSHSAGGKPEEQELGLQATGLRELARKNTNVDIEEPLGGKMGQFKAIMSNLIVAALKENNSDLSSAVSTAVSDSVIKEMDYLLRLKDEREEERYKRFDETIRGYQRGRQEVAATKEKKEKKRGLFGRKKKNY